MTDQSFQSARRARPLPRFSLRALRAAIMERDRIHRQKQHLRNLSPELLDDMGITAADVQEVLRDW